MTTQRIRARLQRCRNERRAALVPFFTAGFPGKSATLDALLAADEAGCDLVEIGVPFSDPLADGPTIQRSSQAALAHGVDLPWILDVVSSFRKHSELPVALMGYYNPFLQYGPVKFAMDAHDAGVDALIVPDLPPDEAGALHAAARAHRLSMVYLIAPTSTPARMRYVSKLCTDFCYCVSVTGVTGARARLGAEVQTYLKRVRRLVDMPIVVGFGLSTPKHVRALAPLADGLVVGSALVPVLERGGSGRKLRQSVHAALKPLVRAASGR